MKVKITRRFVADDGMEFTSAKDCEIYENIYMKTHCIKESTLNKSDFDFMKDVFSAFITQAETIASSLKDEAKLLKEVNPEFSLMCYAGIKKIKLKIKKLAEIQRKIKRMR